MQQSSWSQASLWAAVAIIVSAVFMLELASRSLSGGGSAAATMKWQLVSLRSIATANIQLVLAYSARTVSTQWAKSPLRSLRLNSWPKQQRTRGAFVCLVRISTNTVP